MILKPKQKISGTGDKKGDKRKESVPTAPDRRTVKRDGTGKGQGTRRGNGKKKK